MTEPVLIPTLLHGSGGHFRLRIGTAKTETKIPLQGIQK